MKCSEVIHAYGHNLVQSTHRTTFEITKDETLTKRGDCIIAVRADRGAADLNNIFKKYARRHDSQISIIIEADGVMEKVKAVGDPGLSFTDHHDIVVRKSDYVDGRTVAVKADKAAADLSRRLVEKLQNPNGRIKITLAVETSAP